MSESNGSTKFPPQAVARNVGEFAHDVVTLAELQAELLKVDAQDYVKRLRTPVILFGAAAVVGFACIPIALTALAWGLSAAGLATWLAFLISTVIGLATAAVLATLGWRQLNNSPSMFERSKEELSRNMDWLKHAFKSRKAHSAVKKTV